VIGTKARYDGYADWYDETFRTLADEAGSAGLLARLLGPADPADPICVDLGCGTGLHAGAVTAQGYRVVGFDISADQLRLASGRLPCPVRADATRLPLRDNAVSRLTMTFTHTDVEDFPAVNAVYASYFKPPYPARTFVQVAKLLRGVKVEITVIAAAK